jgi:hypothetical protein
MLHNAKTCRMAGAFKSVASILIASSFLWIWFHRQDAPAAGVLPYVPYPALPRASEEVACPGSSSARPPVVLLILGQSNAANHSYTRGRSSYGALWFDGRCYAITDPLAGATGTGGSIWSALALSTGANSGQRDLMLVVQAVDATRVSDWLGPGSISDRLASTLDALRAQRLAVSAVLWQQGEADAREGTSNEVYAAALTILIHRLRDHGISGPVLLARSTRCRNAGSEDIRRAVARVAQKEPDVFLGPDTDALGDEFRSDGCHFNDAGRQRVADAWLKVLRERGVIDAN